VTAAGRVEIPAHQHCLGYYAGLMTRLAAHVVDTVVISITYAGITWFISTTLTMFQVQALLGMHLADSQALLEKLIGPVAVAALLPAYITIYHIIFWALAGQTPGKALLGLRVLTLKGERVHPLRGALRALGYLLSGLLLGLGFLLILVDDRRQGLHDKLAGTCVVYTWDAHPDESFLADEIRKAARRAPSAR
jgi:uncharacterized RDD family membrane protein YckC